MYIELTRKLRYLLLSNPGEKSRRGHRNSYGSSSKNKPAPPAEEKKDFKLLIFTTRRAGRRLGPELCCTYSNRNRAANPIDATERMQYKRSLNVCVTYRGSHNVPASSAKGALPAFSKSSNVGESDNLNFKLSLHESRIRSACSLCIGYATNFTAGRYCMSHLESHVPLELSFSISALNNASRVSTRAAAYNHGMRYQTGQKIYVVNHGITPWYKTGQERR